MKYDEISLDHGPFDANHTTWKATKIANHSWSLDFDRAGSANWQIAEKKILWFQWCEGAWHTLTDLDLVRCPETFAWPLEKLGY